MKRLILLLFFFCTLNLIAQDFQIEFKKVISDGDWGYYIGRNNRGPYFLDDNNVVYINDQYKLIIYNISLNLEKVIVEVDKRAYLNKTDEIILTDKNKKYVVKDNMLVEDKGDHNLVGNYYFSMGIGIYRKCKELEIIVRNETRGMETTSFVTTPIIDQSETHILFLERYAEHPSHFGYRLMKYDTAMDELSVIYEDVVWFSLIPGAKDLLLIHSLDSEYSKLIMSEFPGDFKIINLHDGSLVQDFDQRDYSLSREFSINTFDINNLNEIVAFGALIKIGENNNVQSNYSPVILLELKQAE